MKKCIAFVIGVLTSLVLFADNFQNPILPGFHPDPSICRVGDNYYLINSTFAWFPSIPIYESKDLVHWQLIGYGITEENYLPPSEGLKDNWGIYAPTIRCHEGMFYIICTCVKAGGNFYITAKDPRGPWSKPVWLPTQGIDPSLFWDDDGRSYYVGHGNISSKKDWPNKTGAWMQEIDLKEGKMKGPRVQLTHGHASNARWTEGPHLYKVDGHYLLLAAEGGTDSFHAVTVFHSDSLWGPYVPDHANPVLTHRNVGKYSPIHSVGHCDIVETQNGEWWAVALGKRKQNGFTYLARETFLVPIEFEQIGDQKWKTPLFYNGTVPMSFTRPNLPFTPVPKVPSRDEFEGETLSSEWNFLRIPQSSWYQLKNGCLAMNLRPEVLDSLVNPTLVAKRMDKIEFTITTQLRFETDKTNEQAGLVIYRTNENHIEFLKEKNGLVVYATSKKTGKQKIGTAYCKEPNLILRIVSDGQLLSFHYGKNEKTMKELKVKCPLSVIADEEIKAFNGPFLGMYATSNGQSSSTICLYDWFDYQ